MVEGEVQRVDFATYRDQIIALRERVWRCADSDLMAQVFRAGFQDDLDEHALHWAVISPDDRVSASARLSVHDDITTIPDAHLLASGNQPPFEYPLAFLNRLVVDMEYQGRGISAGMDQARINQARAMGCKMICGITHGNRAIRLLQAGFVAAPRDLMSIPKDSAMSNGFAPPLTLYLLHL